MHRFTLALAAGLLALAPAQAANAAVTAKVSLAQQRMEVHIDGKLTHTWSVSTGRDEFETPAGSYTPYWLSKDHRSQKYDDAPMPFAVFFKGGYAVHGTTSLSMLGRRASHGCVRLSPANARRFFELVQQHGLAESKVVIHDAPAPRAEKLHVAEIGGRRGRNEPPARPTRAHIAQASRNVTPVYGYGQGASLASVGRHTVAPVLVYHIGPQGQMIPLGYRRF
jgi:L,D-transpeptidase catalytic domain